MRSRYSPYEPVPLPATLARKTPGAVVAEVDRLLDHCTDAGAAAALNATGALSGTGQTFDARAVLRVRRTYGLRPHAQRLAERGLVGLAEAASALGVSTATVKNWHHVGRIAGELANDKGEHLYQLPARAPHEKLGRPAPVTAPTPDSFPFPRGVTTASRPAGARPPLRRTDDHPCNARPDRPRSPVASR